MNIYIVEDDLSIIGILEDIIEDCRLGRVCGNNEGKPVSAGDIMLTAPDVVLVDFLMPEKDGVQVVRELRAAGCTAKIVMISQVSDKDLVAKAYSEGINFFVSKPINLVEVRSVLTAVSNSIRNEQTIASIRQMFSGDPAAVPAAAAKPAGDELESRARLILGKIGMTGEKGTEDIVKLCRYLKDNDTSIGAEGIGSLCRVLSDQPKNMEQRIRRAIAVGMSNVAHLGIEDYMNETFEAYSVSLFSFEEIRTEMDFIRGKSRYNGKVNIRKFIDGLMLEIGRGME